MRRKTTERQLTAAKRERGHSLSVWSPIRSSWTKKARGEIEVLSFEYDKNKLLVNRNPESERGRYDSERQRKEFREAEREIHRDKKRFGEREKASDSERGRER